MEFNPNSHVVKLCLQGMGMEEVGQFEEASKLFLRTWNYASNDFGKVYFRPLCRSSQANRPCSGNRALRWCWEVPLHDDNFRLHTYD